MTEYYSPYFERDYTSEFEICVDDFVEMQRSSERDGKVGCKKEENECQVENEESHATLLFLKPAAQNIPLVKHKRQVEDWTAYRFVLEYKKMGHTQVGVP